VKNPEITRPGCVLGWVHVKALRAGGATGPEPATSAEAVDDLTKCDAWEQETAVWP
jgi:hypothetical protein